MLIAERDCVHLGLPTTGYEGAVVVVTILAIRRGSLVRAPPSRRFPKVAEGRGHRP